MDVSQFSEPKMIDALIADAQPLELQGATCDTYYARIHGRRVFIKRLKEKYRFNPRYLSALEKEFKIGYRLEHKALPRYITFEQDAIVMDFVEGVTLTKFVAENPKYFSVKKNLSRFMMQLLDCVKYLHQNSILHLDLKPENIMISQVGNDVHIVDLGFCYSDTYNETTGYTQSFAAPEQKRSYQEKVGTYTDVFAIGKILEYVLVGQRHNSYISIARKCQNENSQLRPEIEYLLSYFSSTRQKKKVVEVIVGVVILICIGVFIYNIFYPQQIIKPISTISKSTNKDVENAEEVHHDTTTTSTNEKIKLIDNKKSTLINKVSYKYPAPDYPFQSTNSTMEVKRDWYSELRPIYDKILAHYMVVDSMIWFNSTFNQCACSLIENRESSIYKKYNAIPIDDIYNDGMHVFTMIKWMHDGRPFEISGYKRSPRPDLTQYANEQISLFENR